MLTAGNESSDIKGNKNNAKIKLLRVNNKRYKTFKGQISTNLQRSLKMRDKRDYMKSWKLNRLSEMKQVKAL